MILPKFPAACIGTGAAGSLVERIALSGVGIRHAWSLLLAAAVVVRVLAGKRSRTIETHASKG